MRKTITFKSAGLQQPNETPTQYATRIRAVAQELLLVNKTSFNKEAVEAGMSLSQQLSYLGNLPKSNNRNR